jgi:hypothetical protein
MFKTFSAIAAAAVIAGAITFLLPGFGSVNASTPQSVKTDRADSVDCERQGWPYYQHGCIHDESRNAGRAKQVRLITTDRIDIVLPNHTAWPEWSATLADLQVGLPTWARK